MKRKFKPRFLSLLLVAALLAAALSPMAQAADLLSGFQGTQFIFSNTGIRVVEGDQANYSIDGTHLTITGPGNYALSGKCSDGSVSVKKGVTDVQLTLAGLDLASAASAPIVCGKGSHVILYVAGGTENTLSDTAQNNDDNFPDNADAENAVIKCKDGSQVSLCGTGTLNVLAKGKNGIKSGMTTDTEGEAWLEITDLTLNITAEVNDALNAEEKLTVLSGTLTIQAADDAIHSDRTLTIGAADTDGPTILVQSCNEGLEGADLTLYSGDVTVHATDDGLNAANSDLGNYPFSLTIAGGTLYVDTTSGDGIDSNGTLTISGGNVQVYGTDAGDNAPLDADGTFTISGGTVLAVGSGNMAQEPSGSQPFVSFGSRGGFGGRGDWGNKDHGQLPDGTQPGQRPEGWKRPTDTTTPPANGAKDSVDATTQATETVAPADKPEIPADAANPPADITTPPADSSAATLALAAGDIFTVRDETGNALTSGTAVRKTTYVFYSAPQITDGAAYTLDVNGTKAADATATTQGSGGFGGFGGGSRNRFQDVASGDWFFSAVEYVRARGLMTGVSDTQFDPQGSTTRAMIWTILARLNGVDTTAAEGEAWYTRGLNWAVENGISDGSSPNRSISREELMTMLYRCAQTFGSVGDAKDFTLDFPDVIQIHPWAETAVKWWVKSGVVTGKDNLLVPLGTATRAEVATILQRYCQLSA